MITRHSLPLLPLCTLAFALACGGDSSGPPAVATVDISSPSTDLIVGQTAQFAATARDAKGNAVTNRTITWSTSSTSIASVSGAGLVTGVGAGSATITATSEGKAASVQIAVSPAIPASAPQIATVTPSPIVEGQPATITGTNFDASVPGNVVRVDGVPASVTAASATSLQILVPTLNCKPAQNVNVDVSVGGATGAPKSQPFWPAATFTLAQGQQRLIAAAADFCLQFGAAAGAESYLIGVQSVSENVTSVTPAQVTAEAPAGAATLVPPATRLPAGPVFSASPANPLESARAVRIAKHRAVAARLLEQDRTLLAPRLRSLHARSRSMPRANVSMSRAPTIPGTAKVGDVLNIRMPDRNTNSCTSSVPITVTVKSIGTHSIIVEDNGNPPGGFSLSDYQALSDRFDSQIYPTDVSYFGDPTDFDENARIVMVFTKEINKATSVLGTVFLADLFPQSDCPASNEGEIFYGKVPDPGGVVNGTYETAEALLDMPFLIAHEFAHVLQFGRRIVSPVATDLQSTWELEGQATFAEEVNGFVATGLQPGLNLGYAVAFNDPLSSPIDWFIGTWVDLAIYYGYQSRTARTPGAPEECSWLGTRSEGNSGPCLSGREPYGVASSFLRWLSDQFGPAFPGGEQEIHRRFVDNAFTGFATITDVIGVPIDLLLAQWSAALYTDDRVPGVDPKLTFKSWNLKNIESGIVPTAWLTPRDRPFGAFSDQVSVRGGSTAYFIVSGAGRGPTGIRVRDTADGPLPGVMRLWVVRMQ